MLKVAGKPVMDYVLDDVRKLGGVEEIIYITGHLKEVVEAHARALYADFPSTFIEQAVQDGTAGAVALARERVDQPVLIIFVDTIFDADLSVINTSTSDGIIWTKEVEDYQRFGVVVTDTDGHMTRIVEKPREPISKRANIGLYYVKNWKLLFEGIDHVLTQPTNKGEYYLTDAFQYMIDKGAKLKVLDVAGWFDAGKLDTMLETNLAMLNRGRARTGAIPAGSTVNEPVYIEDGVTLDRATIGPNVSIGTGSVIRNSTISDSIIGANTSVTGSTISISLIGDNVLVEGVTGSVSVGDNAEVCGRAS